MHRFRQVASSFLAAAAVACLGLALLTASRSAVADEPLSLSYACSCPANQKYCDSQPLCKKNCNLNKCTLSKGGLPICSVNSCV